MRTQKVEFWHRGKSLILENRGKGKPAVGIQMSDGSTAKWKRLKSFVVHKRTRFNAVLLKAEELAGVLCRPDGDEKEAIARDIYDTLCRMVSWQ